MSTYNSKVIKAVQVKLVSVDEEESGIANRKIAGKEGNSSSPSSTLKLSEIEHLKSEYDKRLKKTEKEAYERGVKEGLRNAEDQTRKESVKGLEAIQNQLKEVALLKKDILKKAEKDILSLSISIAEKIIQQEITSHQDTIQSILKAAMKSILDRDNIKIRLNPSDFSYMMGIKEDFLQGFDGIKNIVIEEDGSIIKGGAVIETQFGEVDARIDRQFAEVKNQLLSSLN